MASDRMRQIVTTVTFLVTLVVNGAANILPTNVISDRFHVYVIPAGYVFSI